VKLLLIVVRACDIVL